jgi:sulfite exporter TauE/SafE
MPRQAVPIVVMGAILIALGLLPDLLSTLVEWIHRLNEEFHRELGSPYRLEPRPLKEYLARGWLAVAGVVLVTLGLLMVITN